MAHCPRSSKRTVKPRRNEEFVYEGSLNFLSARRSSESSIRHSSSEGIYSAVANYQYSSSPVSHPWSDLLYLPSVTEPHTAVPGISVSPITNNRLSLLEGSRSLGQSVSQNNLELHSHSDDSDLCFGAGREPRRTHSSTRLDFLDIYSIVSVSPTARVDTSDMSPSDEGKNQEVRCKNCTKQVKCSTCSDLKDNDDDLATMLRQALGKIDLLTDKFKELEQKVNTLQGTSSSSNDESNSKAGTSGDDSEARSKIDKGKKSKFSKRKVRLEDEKDRQLKVL